MKLPKGGRKFELSKPSVPKPIADVYRELRGQHLLPVVAVLVIGLIAIPLLVGGSESKPKTSTPALGAGAGSAPTLTASRWTPGLLDYQERLKLRKPKDPFSLGPAGGGREPGKGAGEEPEDESKAEPEKTQPGSGGVAIDVRVTAVHLDAATDQVTLRRNQPLMTRLPGDSIPALTYVGPSQDGTKAQMVVSPDVTALLGASRCVIKGDPCQLLALELDAPETLVFGDRGLTYRIELVAVGSEVDPRPGKSNSDASPADEVGLGQAHPSR